jgi:hypothetical protein
LGVLFGHALKTPGARLGALRIIMGAAWLRGLTGLYYYVVYCRPIGFEPDYTTTHSDSVLTVVAMITGLAALSERASRANVLLNLGLQPVLLLALIVNNRRLAFVSLAAGLAALVLIGPPSVRRFLKRSAVVLLPVVALYAAAGWHSTAGVFKPLGMIRSVSSQNDSSSQTRDIENYNLIQTLKPHALVGSGFGHEYVERVRANRVDGYFAQYRYIAHNSVLWLLSISGWAGFSLLWALFPVALLVAVAVYRRSTVSMDRVAAFTTAFAVLCFVLQAWGDMGLQSWLATLVLSSLMGVSGSLFTQLEGAGVVA